MPYLLAIDQGTTSTTVLIVDEKLHICGSASQEFQQFYPKPEFVEHSPDKIWQSVLEAIGTAIARARIDARQIVGIGIANQRETTIVWEARRGSRFIRRLCGNAGGRVRRVRRSRRRELSR